MSSLAKAILGNPAAPAAPAESESDVAAHTAAEELLAAVESKDAKAVRRALRNLRTIDTEE